MESVAVVMDTNVLVSALLWNGIPHEILKLVKVGKVKLFVTIEILNEIEEVLNRDKFTNRILDLRTSVEELMLGLINLVEIVKINRKIKLKPKEIPSDVDDIIFLLCALTANVSYLISGDPHLLKLRMVRNMLLISPRDFFDKVKIE